MTNTKGCGCCAHGCVCLTHQTEDKGRAICDAHRAALQQKARAYFARGGRNPGTLALVLFEQHSSVQYGVIEQLVKDAHAAHAQQQQHKSKGRDAR